MNLISPESLPKNKPLPFTCGDDFIIGAIEEKLKRDGFTVKNINLKVDPDKEISVSGILLKD